MSGADLGGLRSAVALAIAVIAAFPAAVSATPLSSGGIAGGPAPTGSFADVPASVEVAPAIPPSWNAEEVGPLPANTSISVAVGLASKDPGGLAAWVATAATPGTPEFHHYLSPSMAALRFGASAAAVRAAEHYFDGFGLSASAAPDGLVVYVNGPSSGVARAFGTAFDEYREADGRMVYSHPTPADLPAVAPWSGAVGLGNVTPIVPAIAGVARPAAPVPAGTCSAGSVGFLPCTLSTAYNITPLVSSGTNGAGERIAVVDAYSGLEQQPELESDLAKFAALAAVPVGNVSYLYPVPSSGSLNTSGTNTAWGPEEALDIEWARAIAPGATIEMTFSPNAGPGLYAAVDWIVAHGAADVISLSWGEPDVGIFNAFSGPCTAGCNASSDGSYAVLGPVLELAAAEGIGVFAASGDCGSADGTSGVATNFPASDPYVTGVGGTNLSVTGNDWIAETAWSGNQSGASSQGCQNQGGSGGGYSPFPRPWWQTGLPTGTTVRGVPDVAMDAGSPVEIEYQGVPEGVEGTSVGTPIWAAIEAIADQSAHVDLGFLDPSLYQTLESGRYETDFHDIASGGNGYRARPGWDPVTGLGTPLVAALVTDLSRGGSLAGGGLATFVAATPARGSAPLTVRFTVSASGGTGSYPLEGVSFGDSNSSLTKTGSVEYTFASPGVYATQSFVVDSGGNASVSPPLTVVVGGGGPLAVTLAASNETPGTGAPVTFTATVTGGTAPYNYSFWFGDGASADGLSTATAVHAYPVSGVFCAAVEVADSADPVNGGASPAAAIAVGGATSSGCGNSSLPLTVAAIPHPGVRDAPADFPTLFTVSGGTTGNGNPPPTTSLSSNDPYTAACGCAILRSPGNYTVIETAVDSAGASANGTIQLTVAPPLNATFSASKLAGPVPLTIGFSATVSGGYGADASATRWSSGDGGSAVGASVSFTYNQSGEFLVTGVVGDSGYGNASESFLVDAQPDGASPPLGATGTILPSEDVSSGTTVRFSGAVIGAAAPVTLFWEFGGGYSASGPVANQTYFASPPPPDDAVTVELLLEGPGLNPLENLSLALPSFFAVESGGFVPAADTLRLSANVTSTFGPTPLEVHASAAAAGPGGGSVLWEFGGDGSAAGSPVTHTFTAPGNYTVAAEASDPYGDRAVASTVAVVTAPVALVGGPSATGGDVPLTVSFSVEASGGVGGYLYLWTFGNGESATASAAAVTYSQPGVYHVRLEVSDRLGESAGQNWTVTVRLDAVVPVAILATGAAVGIGLAVVLGGAGRRRPRRPVSP